MKKVIGRHTFELKDVLLIEDGAKHNVKPFSIMAYFDKHKEQMEDTQWFLSNFAEIKGLLDPLIHAIIVEGPDTGKLTYGEYFSLIYPAMSALTESMKGLDIPDQPKNE